MSEQILLASGRKEKLSLNDLENIHSSIENTYRISVNSTRNAVLAKRDELQGSINKVCELYQRGNQLNEKLLIYQKKMELINDKNRQIHEKTEYQKNQILIAKQKLFVFNTLNDISKLKREIQSTYQKRNLSSSFVNKTFKEFKNKTTFLQLNDLYNDTFHQCQSYFQKDIQKYYFLDEKSFSFKNISEKIDILNFFELTPVLLQSFWHFINSTFLLNLSKGQNLLNISKDKVLIEIKPNTKNNPVDFIKASTSLLEAIIKKFEKLQIKINDEDLKNFANNSIEIGLTLQGGQLPILNKETAKLCQIAKIPNVTLDDVMKKARLPAALDRCRELLKEGKPFALVINEMRQIMEGANTDGILKQITAMAILFWKDDKAKLQLAINPLLSIGTPESLECVMMFDNALPYT